jgi:transcriptional regulator with XRE-family HTH domain
VIQTNPFQQIMPSVLYHGIPAEGSGKVHNAPSGIYAYEDYRAFLKDRFEQLNGQDPLFSQRRLARESGILNPGYFNEVIKGRRSLTDSSARKLAHGLRLGESETEFLLSLVEWSVCRNPAAKLLAEKRLMKLRAKHLCQDPGEEESSDYSREMFTELLNHWSVESTRFALEGLGNSASFFPNAAGEARRASIESLTVLREMAAEGEGIEGENEERVFQISLRIKPRSDSR